MSGHKGFSEREADRIERQLAAAVLVAREMRRAPLDGREPTGCLVVDPVARKAVFERQA